MAVKKTLTIPSKGSSFQITDAYVSVSMVRVRPMYDKDGQKYWQLQASIEVHVDRDAKIAGLDPIDSDQLRENFPANSNINPLAWVYQELKKKSRFAGAVDVIE